MANGYGYEEEYGLNVAEQAAREEQAKAIAAREQQALIESGMGGQEGLGGYVPTTPTTPQPGAQNGNGWLNVPGATPGVTGALEGNGVTGTLSQDQAKTIIAQTGQETNGGAQNGQIVNGAQNGQIVNGAQNGEAVSGFPSTQDEAFTDITGEAQDAFKAGREQQQAQSEAAAAAGLPSFMTDTGQQIIGTDPTTGEPFEQAGKAVSTAPTDIAMSSEQDLTDDDFRNVWDRVNRNAIPMAQLGNFLKFETTDVVVGTDANGDPITARETRMSARSKQLLDRAISVESENRIAEQEKYERDLAKAELTGDFRGTETLEKRKTNLQEKLAKAEATGMFGEEATLAKQKLDLEERIDYANRTGMYKDPNTNRYEKTLLLKKMEQDKDLADLEMQMQETALMGADPDGVVTFAKEQWLDQINTDKDRYDDAVTQLGVENDMRMLEILGTSKRDAYVYDEEGNIQFDSKGNPILQTLAAKQLAEDMLTGQVNRDDIKARTAELSKSNRKAEEFRLMEIMGYSEDVDTKEKIQTFAAKQFDEKVRAAKKAEELRGTELELERTMLASEMDYKRQELGSQNLALMLQNPAAFGALQAMQGGMMPQQLQGLGMQLPTAQQPGQAAPQTPQQGIGQFFQGGIPTLGQLGELDPQAMQTLTSMLGYAAGVRPEQLGRAAAGVTPGGMQAGPAQVYAGGMPTGRR